VTHIHLLDDGQTHCLRLVLGEQRLPVGRTLGEKA
jgi:hypothetical protein